LLLFDKSIVMLVFFFVPIFAVSPSARAPLLNRLLPGTPRHVLAARQPEEKGGEREEGFLGRYFDVMMGIAKENHRQKKLGFNRRID